MWFPSVSLTYFTKKVVDLPGLMPGENVEKIANELAKEKGIVLETKIANALDENDFVFEKQDKFIPFNALTVVSATL